MFDSLIQSITEDDLNKRIFVVLSELVSLDDTNMQINLDTVNMILSNRPSYFADYTAVLLWAYNTMDIIDDYRSSMDVVIVNRNSEDNSQVYHVKSGKVLTMREAVQVIADRCDFICSSNIRKGLTSTCKNVVETFQEHNEISCIAQAQRVRGLMQQSQDTTYFVK